MAKLLTKVKNLHRKFTQNVFCAQFPQPMQPFFEKCKTKQLFLVFLVAKFRHSASPVSTGSQQIEGFLNPSAYMARSCLMDDSKVCYTRNLRKKTLLGKESLE
jgi:hypothetical protein